MTPDVTTVIAAYNPGPFLRPAIASVLDQSVRSSEIIVIDDGSTEDLSWVATLAPRVRLVSRPNGGVSTARNLGVSLSAAPVIAFLDQDDAWEPMKLERQFELLTDDVDVVHTGFDLVDEESTRINVGYGRAVTYHDMLRGELGVLLSSVLIRKTALMSAGLFNPLLAMQQDLDLFLRLSLVRRFAYVPSTEVHYRIHHTNASKNYQRAAAEILDLYDSHATLARDQRDREALRNLRRGRHAVRRTYAFQAIDVARVQNRERRPAAAAMTLARAGRLSPRVLADAVRAAVRS